MEVIQNNCDNNNDSFFFYKLTIELIPSTVWFSSVFQICKRKNQKEKWKKIKEDIFKVEGKRCWICGTENTRLEAHEFWKYDDKNHIQKLVAIHYLCSMCHKIKHIGFWCYTDIGITQLNKTGLGKEDLINHFCKINNCSKKEFEKHEKESFRIWRERSEHEWKQDFGDYSSTILMDESTTHCL